MKNKAQCIHQGKCNSYNLETVTIKTDISLNEETSARFIEKTTIKASNLSEYMDINLVIGLSGIALSILSLIYAVHVTKISKHEKSLVYEVLEAVPIAEVVKGQKDYSLQLIYKQPKKEPLSIEHAFVQYIRLTNFGHTPIKYEDLASTDPLRIEATPKKGRVLDISLSGVTRDTCKIIIDKQESTNNSVTAHINFEFLDHLDGCLVQILSDTPIIQSRLCGTIVGMPDGIKKSPDKSDGIPIPTWGCIIGVILEILAIAAAIYIYFLFVGNWGLLWILALPLIPLIMPSAIFAIFMSVFESQKGFKFPKSLLPPTWYGLQGRMMMRHNTLYYDEELLHDRETKKKKRNNTK